MSDLELPEGVCNIRAARVEDAAQLVHLMRTFAKEENESCPINDRYVETYLAHPGSQVLIAELGGQIVGLISYSVRPDLYHAGQAALIEAFYILPSFRDKGAGSALLTVLLQQSQAQGWVEISVGVLPGNEGAIQFYQKYGFKDQALLLEQHFRG